jgi:NAD(P)-dependent dehydrogenase (short-subunit alcohol dehydrogenase family)
MSDAFRLDGQVAVMVGTSPNIGAGIALRLAAAGAKVACVDLDPAAASAVAREIRALGGSAAPFACDVTDESQVTRTLDDITAELGPAEHLVNGPVRYLEKGIRTMTLAEWRYQLAVLLDGPFLFTKHVAERLIAAGTEGSVLNLISTAGHQGEPGNIGYATAKAALLNFTRSAAVELAPHGIRVNSLTPTSTDLTEGLERSTRWGMSTVLPEHVDAVRMAADQVPLGRLPTPSDYGNAAVFLASRAARSVTGADLPVDAGSLAKYWRTKPGAQLAHSLGRTPLEHTP